jgi:hypothetical protein
MSYNKSVPGLFVPSVVIPKWHKGPGNRAQQSEYETELPSQGSPGKSGKGYFYLRGERFIYNKPPVSAKLHHEHAVTDLRKNCVGGTNTTFFEWGKNVTKLKPLNSQFDPERARGVFGARQHALNPSSVNFVGHTNTGRQLVPKVFGKNYGQDATSLSTCRM